VGCNEGTSASGSRYVNSLTLTAPGKYPNGSAYSGRLNGKLPGSLTLLEKLETLTLSGNALSGGLPASWSSMATLTSIVVDGNKLTGTIPRSWLCRRRSDVPPASRPAIRGGGRRAPPASSNQQEQQQQSSHQHTRTRTSTAQPWRTSSARPTRSRAGRAWHSRRSSASLR
jgi:hypothetical protein